MTPRERFSALMNYRPVDRLPLYYFGTWPETKQRWRDEGLTSAFQRGRGSGGPQLPEMDEDWETGPDGEGCIWNNQGVIDPNPMPNARSEVIEQTATSRIVRSPLGGISTHSLQGSSIPHQIEPDLKATREDWQRFKHFLNPEDPRRWLAGHEQRAAELRRRGRVTCFLGGSLYGWLRNWMGVEQISLLMYDDPVLLNDMVGDMADYFLAIADKLLPRADFDFAYFFEDCCGRSGPLVPPDIYRRIFHPHYCRMLGWYRDRGVPLILMDSDGDVAQLIGCWMESGFDILFPIEVGVWQASPPAIRARYGRRLRMMGGVDKHVIPHGEAAIRRALEPLKALAREGGFLPMPDHRIPPDCSLAQFRTYLRVFQEVFAL
jgi:uroporphyrinogen decarboxylase